MSPFLAWDDFHARSRFAFSTIPTEKWGTIRSLETTILVYFQKQPHGRIYKWPKAGGGVALLL